MAIQCLGNLKERMRAEPLENVIIFDEFDEAQRASDVEDCPSTEDRALVVDHIILRNAGGSDDLSNLQAL